MKLSEIKGERALEVLADLIEPIKILATDEKFRTELSKDKLSGIKYLLKNQSKTIITVLAIVNGEDPETYEPNLLTLPMTLIEFFNDPSIMELFGLQSQTSEKTSSGSVTVNTEASKA